MVRYCQRLILSTGSSLLRRLLPLLVEHSGLIYVHLCLSGTYSIKLLGQYSVLILFLKS